MIPREVEGSGSALLQMLIRGRISVEQALQMAGGRFVSGVAVVPGN